MKLFILLLTVTISFVQAKPQHLERQHKNNMKERRQRGKFNLYADQTYRKLSNTLTLHIIRSPYGMDWEGKPRSVLIDLLKNKYLFPDTKRALGHVTVELNCQNDKGQNDRFIGGQGALELMKFSKMIKEDGVGFSILNGPMNNYSDLPMLTVKGRFESLSDLQSEYDELIHVSNKMAFLTYKISNSQCKKMTEFFNEYKKVSLETIDSNSPMAANNYGFGADPLKFEGAGCAPFAQAFFQVGELEDHFEKFIRTVYVNEKYLGNPAEGKRVSLGTLLTASDNIGTDGEGKRMFKFPDPDLMFEYAKESKSEKFGKSRAYYLVIDTLK